MPSRIFIFLVVVVISSSCGGGEDGGEIIPETPGAIITSGPEEVVNAPQVTFQWKGSNKFVNEFAYRWMPYYDENWSEWSSIKSVTLRYLDEGEYTFEVKGRYEDESESDEPTVWTFTVDIAGPGVFLKPLKRRAKLNEEFEIEVWVDEVESSMLAHLILKFEPAQLRALEAVPGDMFQGNYPPAFFETIDESEGIVDISMSTIGTNLPTVKGTGAIAAIRFKSLSIGESDVDFDSGSDLRDPANKPIAIITWIGSNIEIMQ